MLTAAFASLLMVDSVTIIGLTTVAVLTFLLIGLPALYLLALIVADDDDAFDRRVRDIEQSVKLGQRLHGTSPARTFMPFSRSRSPWHRSAVDRRSRMTAMCRTPHEP
jgi:hypothetical protein